MLLQVCGFPKSVILSEALGRVEGSPQTARPWLYQGFHLSVAPPGLFVLWAGRFLGLTPQAKYLSPLRGSRVGWSLIGVLYRSVAAARSDHPEGKRRAWKRRRRGIFLAWGVSPRKSDQQKTKPRRGDRLSGDRVRLSSPRLSVDRIHTWRCGGPKKSLRERQRAFVSLWLRRVRCDGCDECDGCDGCDGCDEN